MTSDTDKLLRQILRELKRLRAAVEGAQGETDDQEAERDETEMRGAPTDENSRLHG